MKLRARFLVLRSLNAIVMSKIQFLREALLELLREHERDDMLPTNGRFLFYELVTRNIVSKEKRGARRPDQDSNDALIDLRESGTNPVGLDRR
jgi:hypothetical protein